MSVEVVTEQPAQGRVVPAVFGRAETAHDPAWEWEYAAHLKLAFGGAYLNALYAKYRNEEGPFESQLRRILVRALCKRAGHGLRIEPQVVWKHAETIEIGDAVFIGAHTMIQGRFDGLCRIGNHVWIGPHSYLDARNLVLEDYVGWGPGAKVLGSSHTGEPVQLPIIATPLTIKPVVVGYGSDIGTNATLLPGIRIGANAIVGAGAVVTEDVPDYGVVAGVPARILRFRK